MKKLAVVRHDRINEWDMGTFSGVGNDEIEVIACGTKAVDVPNVTSFVYVFPSQVMELEPDVIDVADPHYEWSQYFCARHERTVVSAWDNLLGKNHDAKSKQAMKQAWKFVARTQMIRDALVWDGVPEENITVVPAAVDCELFHPLPLEDREDAVLFCGRVVPEKGLKDLIWAMKGVPAALWAAGSVSDEDRDFYDHWAFQAGVELVWLGFLGREQLADKMRRAKVFSCPSYPLGDRNPFGEWLEQFGQVYIEALASGTPVATTDCGGPSEILDDGRTAWLVPARHWHHLYAALDFLLGSPACWQGYSERARHDALRLYSTKAVGKRLTEVYFGD